MEAQTINPKLKPATANKATSIRLPCRENEMTAAIVSGAR